MLVAELREVLDQFHPLTPVAGVIERDLYTGACVVGGLEDPPEWDEVECERRHLDDANGVELLRKLSRHRGDAEPTPATTPVGELRLVDLVKWACFRFREWDAAEVIRRARPVVDTKPLP